MEDLDHVFHQEPWSDGPELCELKMALARNTSGETGLQLHAIPTNREDSNESVPLPGMTKLEIAAVIMSRERKPMIANGGGHAKEAARTNRTSHRKS